MQVSDAAASSQELQTGAPATRRLFGLPGARRAWAAAPRRPRCPAATASAPPRAGRRGGARAATPPPTRCAAPGPRLPAEPARGAPAAGHRCLPRRATREIGFKQPATVRCIWPVPCCSITISYEALARMARMQSQGAFLTQHSNGMRDHCLWSFLPKVLNSGRNGRRTSHHHHRRERS